MVVVTKFSNSIQAESCPLLATNSQTFTQNMLIQLDIVYACNMSTGILTSPSPYTSQKLPYHHNIFLETAMQKKSPRSEATPTYNNHHMTKRMHSLQQLKHFLNPTSNSLPTKLANSKTQLRTTALRSLSAIPTNKRQLGAQNRPRKNHLPA